VGGSWRCDETYVKVKGRWTCLYRAVDKVGRTVDFYLSERRDVNAAKHFLRKVLVQTLRADKMDECRDSQRWRNFLKADTLTRRLWCCAFVGT
jgi:transposase-like protein